MKNLKKLSRKELKDLKGGTPGFVQLGGGGSPTINCYQYMEAFYLDCNTEPENEVCKVCSGN